jgi:PhnB protein
LAPETASDDTAQSDWADDAAGAETWEPTPELTYIHDTLLEALPRLRESRA